MFADGQTESVVSLPIVHDNDPNEGCEFVQVGLTAVSGTGSAVLNGGIHDVSAEAVVLIEEDDFTSAVRTTAPPEGLDAAGGGLSPATAEVGGSVGRLVGVLYHSKYVLSVVYLSENTTRACPNSVLGCAPVAGCVDDIFTM